MIKKIKNLKGNSGIYSFETNPRNLESMVNDKNSYYYMLKVVEVADSRISMVEARFENAGYKLLLCYRCVSVPIPIVHYPLD